MQNSLNLEVCLTPALFDSYKYQNVIVVVVDIFRATSAIATALEHGVKEIIPVGTIEEARIYKDKGFLIAAERDGIMLDFADFGNSPYNFIGQKLEGKTIVYSTTNGTQAIQLAEKCKKVVIGSFLNHTAVSSWLKNQGSDIVILCAGWKGKFNFEDAVYAGALAKTLIEDSFFSTICDSTLACIDLWSLAEKDLLTYKEKFAHRHRLKKLNLDDVVEYCLTFDINNVIPVYQNGVIINISDSTIQNKQ